MKTTEAQRYTHPKYRPDIDGLRAISVLSVVGFHFFPEYIQGGFIGVDVFFVISGYLISIIILENLQNDGFGFLDFYTRRIIRIFPALLLILIACLAFGWFNLLTDEYKQLGKHVAGAGGFISNFLFWNESGYFDNSAETKPLLHLWSLGIEEQFYIIWPLLIWLVYKLRFNVSIITLALLLISFTLNIKNISVDPVATFYSPLTRFWELFSGGLLASTTFYRGNLIDLQTTRMPIKSNLAVFANFQSWLGFLLIALGFFEFKKTINYPGYYALAPILGALLIISADPKSLLNRVILSNKLLVSIGLISFPLYLWHWPLLTFMRIIEGGIPDENIRIATLALSLLLSWLTYILIERPFRNEGWRATKALTLIMLMIAVIFCGYYTFKQDGLNSRPLTIKMHDYEKTMFMSEKKQCQDLPYAYKSNGEWFCKIGNVNIPPTIFAFGDSHAFSLLPALEKFSADNNLSILFASGSGCLPLLGVKVDRGADWLEKYNCPKLNNRIFNYVKEHQIKNVFLISYWTYYDKSNVVLADDAVLQNNKVRLLDNIWQGGVWYDFGINNTIERYTSLGVKLFLFEDNPTQKFEPRMAIRKAFGAENKIIQFSLETIFDSFNVGKKINQFSISEVEHRQRQKYIVDKFSKIDNPLVKVFNFDDLLCAKDICPIENNGSILYFDIHHLSSSGAMLTYPKIKEIFFSLQ